MVSGLWICVLIVIPYMVLWSSASTLSVSEIQATGKILFRELRDSECKVKCKSRKPRIMCGSDGVSYLSKCEVKRARRCEGKKVTIKRRGKCSEVDVPMTKCFQEKQEAEATVTRSGDLDVFIPKCNADGTFAEIQCHSASGYCWCASSDGKPFPRTSTQKGTPDCDSKDTRIESEPKHKPKTKKKKGKRKKKPKSPDRCTSLERTRFNSKLVRVFTEEYNRSIKAFPNNKPNKVDSLMDTLEKQVVEWKFTQYDSNVDDLLQMKEVNALRRLVKKFIKPRSCAKRFLKFCDHDKDKLIRRSEWSLCLGVDINNDQQETTTHAPEVKTTGEHLHKILNNKKSSPSSSSSKTDKALSLTSAGQIETPFFPTPPFDNADSLPHFGRPRSEAKPKPQKQQNDCQTDRQAALEQEQDNPDGGIFVPNCTPDGNWARAQCHKSTGYCWCVDEDSGRPISGTSTHGVDPKCDFEEEREIEGCSYAEKRTFLSDLLNTLTAEMAEYALNNDTDHSLLMTDSDISLQERVVRWRFAVLDTSGDQNLENSELENFKDTLKAAQTKVTRKCARKFVRYCDENGDKTVSSDEWIDCMGITRPNLPSNPKRIGKNPFDEYLQDT